MDRPKGRYSRSFTRPRQVLSVLSGMLRSPDVVKQVRDDGLTLLREDALTDLHDEVQRVDSEGIEGVLIEAGTARGGSAIVMAKAKRAERPLEVYDTFSLIPPPTELDGQDVQERYEAIAAGEATGRNGKQYYGYVKDLKGEVTQSFADCGVPIDDHAVSLHEGLFQDTLSPDAPVALAHLDGDWYDSVMVCLERIVPYLSVGGVLVIDDYDAWSGCQRAVDDFLEQTDADLETAWKARLHIRRKS